MAGKKNDKQEESQAVVDGTQVRQTPEAPAPSASESPEAGSGEVLVKINPLLDTLTVTIPKGLDSDGQVERDEYEQGKTYVVDESLLEHKTTEGLSKFVEA